MFVQSLAFTQCQEVSSARCREKLGVVGLTEGGTVGRCRFGLVDFSSYEYERRLRARFVLTPLGSCIGVAKRLRADKCGML